MGSLSLLQGIFPTQGSNPSLPHCRGILYQLSHKGSPRMLQWVAYPFCRGSSRPRNWTGASCTAGGFFTNWAIKEVHPRTKRLWISWLQSLSTAISEPRKIKSVTVSTSQQTEGGKWRQWQQQQPFHKIETILDFKTKVLIVLLRNS